MVYLIHFDSPYHHAQHYIGYADDAEKRFKKHGTSAGSNLLRAVNNSGIPFKIARTWPGGRQEERQLKRQKNAARYCPICSQKGFLEEDMQKDNRIRIVGSQSISLTPNLPYLRKYNPDVAKEIEDQRANEKEGRGNRKRIIDVNKLNRSKKSK